MSTKIIIIGGDAAGMSAASKVRREMKDARLVVFERDQHISYAACGMPYWFNGVVKSEADLLALTWTTPGVWSSPMAASARPCATCSITGKA